MMSSQDLKQQLLPLIDAMGQQGLRLVASPDRITVEGAWGLRAVEQAWDEGMHRALMDSIPKSGIEVENGIGVYTVGDCVVMLRAPMPSRSMDALMTEGFVSDLGGRLLMATSSMGKNILVAGPFGAAVSLMTAMGQCGVRPCVVGGPKQLVPKGWLRVSHCADARILGVDRHIAWDQNADDLVNIMMHQTGVMGWMDARDLSRALIRFEVASAKVCQHGQAAMGVLAGIDLVVVVANHDAPRVVELSEIVLTEDGYRPYTLFTMGVAPVPTALVPTAVPTFAMAMMLMGHGVLVDELRHGVPAAPSHELPHQEIAPEPMVQQPHVEREVPPTVVPQIVFTPDNQDAPPPGWELDQIDDDALSQEATPHAPPNGDAAMMAASFGLAPPQSPVGQRGEYGNTFADALDRAKQRDAELQRALQQPEEES